MIACRHLGREPLRTAECVSCKGRVRIKIYECGQFGECTLAREHFGRPVCATCPAYVPGDRRPLSEPATRISAAPSSTQHVSYSTRRIDGLHGEIATNCSVYNWQGRRMFAYRSGWGGAQIWLGELDDSLKLLWHRRLVMPQVHHNSLSREDPRLFAHAGRLHISYVGVEPRGRGIVTNVMVARLTEDLRVESTWLPQIERRRGWEKNWSFFSRGNNLYCVYDIERSHAVIRFEGSKEVRRWASSYANVWRHGEKKGGASPVLVDGVWWHFFHATQQTASGRLYSLGLYTFEDAAPFRPIAFISQPLIVPDPLDRPGPSTPYVVFPCGAMFDRGRWLVSYGYYDQTSRVATFKHADLLAALTSV